MNSLKTSIFTGKLVRLTMEDSETMAAAMVRWQRDTEFWSSLSGDPAQAFSKNGLKTWVEKMQERQGGQDFRLMIRTLAEDRLIGDISLHVIQWAYADAWVGIGIGERDCWGKGYGTDAMRLMLDYAFDELNLHRVSLEVLENNARGIRSYEKAGFTVEGRQRQVLCRAGRRWDVITMGILRSEWAALQGHTK